VNDAMVIVEDSPELPVTVAVNDHGKIEEVSIDQPVDMADDGEYYKPGAKFVDLLTSCD
jgi:hypothetical protein